MASNEVMRKRGWSVHSEHTAGDTTVGSDDRSLSHDEKRLLLDSIPTTTTSKSHDDDEDDDFSVGDAPETTPLSSSLPPNKRLKLETNDDCSPNNNNDNDNDGREEQQQHQERMLELAKTKLSKWAARLFDPNRPRGLIEPPQTIPLNDEFLQAFGKREKEFDSKVGRTIDIDVSTLGNVNDDDDADDGSATNETTTPKSKKKTKKELEKEKEGRKLKITNMAFRTTEETLQKTCEVYGPLEELNLIMNKDNASMNAGRA
eukprot:CAMPEP_0195301960 /NCGR_PEP_ID=MMETSP0707-20130614/30262_1 /TAXON_ID=33640 /ORGANISM="Asterionellopsis glacialis, Strain CCMP134" /LENGTH=259 /DNA_ID=CAMNT_0040365075 /DNA_START=49 /DNA_END=824 /DNA_ORIENTATION=+